VCHGILCYIYQQPPKITNRHSNSFCLFPKIHSPKVFCVCEAIRYSGNEQGQTDRQTDSHPVLIPYGRPGEGRGGCVELRADGLARGSADTAGGPATAYPGRTTDTRRWVSVSARS
jgi:hypothetical protein